MVEWEGLQTVIGVCEREYFAEFKFLVVFLPRFFGK